MAMTVATHLAVFFATDSKILRRKVIPDDDGELAQLRPEPGESMLLLPVARPFDDAACRAAIAEATGCKPPSGRCCVLDESGDVVAICNADPALDTHPQGQLIANEHARPGDRYIGGVFLNGEE
ncbi:MAG: hypothetical protein WA633_28205 [Stellaceae bacterium]